MTPRHDKILNRLKMNTWYDSIWSWIMINPSSFHHKIGWIHDTCNTCPINRWWSEPLQAFFVQIWFKSWSNVGWQPTFREKIPRNIWNSGKVSVDLTFMMPSPSFRHGFIIIHDQTKFLYLFQLLHRFGSRPTRHIWSVKTGLKNENDRKEKWENIEEHVCRLGGLGVIVQVCCVPHFLCFVSAFCGYVQALQPRHLTYRLSNAPCCFATDGVASCLTFHAIAGCAIKQRGCTICLSVLWCQETVQWRACLVLLFLLCLRRKKIAFSHNSKQAVSISQTSYFNSIRQVFRIPTAKKKQPPPRSPRSPRSPSLSSSRGLVEPNGCSVDGGVPWLWGR